MQEPSRNCPTSFALPPLQHRVPGFLKVPSEVAVPGGVFKTDPQALARNAVEVQPVPAEGQGALAAVGAQTGALCILWVLGPASAKGAVPCALPCGKSAKFTASLENSCIR